MLQKEIYLKPIERDLEGVIKASDMTEASLLQEVEEYILTEEILGKISGKRMLPGFFEELAKPTYRFSVWIAGHYGSGKSHLLKILSIVLDNQELKNRKYGEIFLKNTVIDSELHRLVNEALQVPTKTILFNIQTKVDSSDTALKIDILAIFLKVFNESCGYSSTPEIAEIERQLEEDGLYEEFKEKYQTKFNKSWIGKGRDNILLNVNELADIYYVLKKMDRSEAFTILDNYLNNYKIDITNFVKLIVKYLSKKNEKAPGFRLIFCVDELGQFIAGSMPAMLSIQTIAEELSVQTKGQAFLIVTSQSDLDSTLNGLNSANTNDFSKISARFAYKISLTSSNSDEVIQKRILAKTDEGANLLTKIYNKEHNNLKAWFVFNDNSRQYPNFKSQEDFIATYPFVPYQFDLFQTCLKTFSDNGHFTGTNKSIGERSMLEYFKKTAVFTGNNELNSITPFSDLFDNLKDDLQGPVQIAINEAEKNITNKTAVKVLKALFMVKYIKAFVATPNNLAILLFDSFKTDLTILTKEVQEALNYLESQTYIHKLNNTYEFLTNEEKDIENEIKATELATTAVGELLYEIIYEEILKDDKFKMPNSTRAFQFGKKIDDNAKGKGSEFYVNFITSLNRNDYDTKTLIAKSLGEATDLFIKLPADSKLIDELSLILKIERYANNSNSNKGDSKKNAIISEKVRQNTQRKSSLTNKLIEAIGDALLFQNGAQLNITYKDPKSKITLGLHQLIEVVYPQLKMIKSDFNEESVKNTLINPDSGDDISPPEQEVLSSISRKKNANEKVTVKTVLETYTIRPYGWPELGIITIVAKLYKRGKLNFRKDGSVVSENELFKTLINNREYEKVVIDIEANISDKQIKALKDLHHEFFNEANQGVDAKTVSKLFKEALAKESSLLTSFLVLKNTFTFLDVLAAPLDLINALNKQDHPYYYTDFTKFDNDLITYKESTLSDLKAFMQGPNKELWGKMLNFSELEKANLNYISEDNVNELNTLKKEKTPYKGDIMKRVKDTLEQLNNEIDSLRVTEREKACNEINEISDKIKSLEHFSKLKSNEQTEVLKPFAMTVNDIKTEGFIGNIQNSVNRVKSIIYAEQLKLLTHYLTAQKEETDNDPQENSPKPQENENGTESDTTPASNTTPSPLNYMPKNEITTARYTKLTIDTKEDVENYITILKEVYTDLIEKNNKIIL